MKEKPFYGRTGLVACLCLVLFSSPAVFPQTADGYIKKTLTRIEVDELLCMLRDAGKFVEIQEKFFNMAGGEDGVYMPNLANLVFFIDEVQSSPPLEHKVNIRLIKAGKGKKVLFGERYVYALVFVATKDKGPLSLSARCSSLEWRRPSGDFVLLAIFKDLIGALQGLSIDDKAGEEEGGQAPGDLNMSLLGSSGSTRLLCGLASIPIGINTTNRITIQGFENISPQATFGNYSKSRITSSIGLMHSPSLKVNDFSRVKDLSAEERGPYFNALVSGQKKSSIDPFLFLHYYLLRPQLPERQFEDKIFMRDLLKGTSLSFVVGTNGKAPITDSIFFGACVGNVLVESIGLTVGANLRKFKFVDDDQMEEGISLDKNKAAKTNICDFSIGLTFIF